MPRTLGQHFLTDRALAKKIVAALDARAGETIVEIGAGHGELTAELCAAERNIRVIALEKDPKLARNLKERFSDVPNLAITEGDVRHVLPSEIRAIGGDYKIAGNIPYYLTGYLLRMLSALSPQPVRSVLMVQEEVAERISARPPRMNKLAASVQIWAEATRIARVPRASFNPPPGVDSAVLRLERKRGNISSRDMNRYYSMVRMLFSQPRKTILNNLASGTDKDKKTVAASLETLRLRPGARPQDLAIRDIENLAEHFAPRGDDLHHAKPEL